jgi:hypothetical protein
MLVQVRATRKIVRMLPHRTREVGGGVLHIKIPHFDNVPLSLSQVSLFVAIVAKAIFSSQMCRIADDIIRTLGTSSKTC